MASMSSTSLTVSAILIALFFLLFQWSNAVFRIQQIEVAPFLHQLRTGHDNSLVRRAGLEQDLNSTPTEQQEEIAATLARGVNVDPNTFETTRSHNVEPLLSLSSVSAIGSRLPAVDSRLQIHAGVKLVNSDTDLGSSSQADRSNRE